MMMIEVKVASLTTVVFLKYLQSNHKVNLNYNSSVDYLSFEDLFVNVNVILINYPGLCYI